MILKRIPMKTSCFTKYIWDFQNNLSSSITPKKFTSLTYCIFVPFKYNFTLKCFVFPAELLSRHVEHFWFHYGSWKHHRNSGGFAGKTWAGCHSPWREQQLFVSFPTRTTVPLCRHSLSHVVLNFAICGLHPGCHSLLYLCHPLCNHALVSPSRWTPSIWVSWSFSEQLGWSSCWGRATPSAFCCGPSCNHSRCDISTTTLFFPSSLKDEDVFLKEQLSSVLCCLCSDRLFLTSAF